jgi:uncharacterized membrane protein YdjX (TVP38/TMEM64 family)
MIGLAAWLVTRDMPAVHSFIRDRGPIGLLVSIPVYTSLGATVIPSEPLTLLVAGLYGPLVAAVIASIGNLGAAMLEYYLGTRLGSAAGYLERKQRLPFGLHRLPVNSPIFLIFGRMLPGYGAKLIGLLSGACRVPFGLYLWTSAIQTILGAATFAYGGWGVVELLKR